MPLRKNPLHTPVSHPPRRRPAFPKIKPWEERTPRARGKLTTSVRSFRAWRRASFCRRTRGARRRRPCIGWANISRSCKAAARPGGPAAPKPCGCTGCTSASRSWRTWRGCRGTGKMRDGLAPFVGQRHRFAATIDRIGVKDGWRSAVTVLLKDVELADTGAVVAGPWADELASGPWHGGGLVLSVLWLATRWLETALFTAMAVNYHHR